MTIKEMRKNKGMTQRELAEEIGVNIRWIQKLEAGEIKLENITFLNAIKLITALTPYDDEKQIARDLYMIVKWTLKENSSGQQGSGQQGSGQQVKTGGAE